MATRVGALEHFINIHRYPINYTWKTHHRYSRTDTKCAPWSRSILRCRLFVEWHVCEKCGDISQNILDFNRFHGYIDATNYSIMESSFMTTYPISIHRTLWHFRVLFAIILSNVTKITSSQVRDVLYVSDLACAASCRCRNETAEKSTKTAENNYCRK